jgi:hypothetical protein
MEQQLEHNKMIPVTLVGAEIATESYNEVHYFFLGFFSFRILLGLSVAFRPKCPFSHFPGMTLLFPLAKPHFVTVQV